MYGPVQPITCPPAALVNVDVIADASSGVELATRPPVPGCA